MKKQRFVSIVLLLVLLFTLVGCGSKQPSSSESSSKGDTIEPVKIGLVLPLTGTAVQYGQKTLRGAQLAEKLINDAGGVLNGRPVKLIIEDDKSDAATAVSAVERLINTEKVVAIVGGPVSAETMALAGAVSKYQIPFMAVAGSSDKIEKQYGDKRWLFHLYPYGYHTADRVVEFVKTLDPQPKSIAVLQDEGMSAAMASAEALKKAGYNIVTQEKYKTGVVDLTPSLSKIKSKNPDIVAMWGYPADLILASRQMDQIGLKPNLFMDGTSVGDPKYVEAVGKTAAEGKLGGGVYFVGGKYPASEKYPKIFPDNQTWVSLYKKQFTDYAPEDISVHGYVGMAALGIGINEAGSTEPDAIISKLEALDTMTPMGPLKFSKTIMGSLHQGFTGYTFYQWQDGKLVGVWPKEAAEGKLRYPAK